MSKSLSIYKKLPRTMKHDKIKELATSVDNVKSEDFAKRIERAKLRQVAEKGEFGASKMKSSKRKSL